MKTAKEQVSEVKGFLWNKYRNVVYLYFVMSILFVLAISAMAHAGWFNKHTIIATFVNAEEVAEDQQEVETIEIVDCASAVDFWSKEYGMSQDLMHRIMQSESGNEAHAENSVSTATGCFQFILGTWRLYGKRLWGDDFYEKNIYNPSDNAELAAWSMSQYGTGDWDASKHAWRK